MGRKKHHNPHYFPPKCTHLPSTSRRNSLLPFFSSLSLSEHYFLTSVFQPRLLPPPQPRGGWELLSDVPDICICSPAQEAALEVRSVTPVWLSSAIVIRVCSNNSSKASGRLFLLFGCVFASQTPLNPPASRVSASSAISGSSLCIFLKAF
jgi:hypothetical protein